MAINETVFNESMKAFLSQMSAQMPAFAFLSISIILVAMVLGVLIFAAWIWVIVDCAKRKKFRHGDRVLWILLLVLTGIIGMILYYFMEMYKK